MGVGFTHICKKCNNENQIYFGIGFLDCPSYYTDNKFKNLIELGIEENLYNINKLKEFINLKNVRLRDNYERKAYLCNNCHILHTKFRYTLVSDNKVFNPKYKCSHCGNLLRIKKKNEDYKIKCKICGNEDFQKDVPIEMLNMYLWD